MGVRRGGGTCFLISARGRTWRKEYALSVSGALRLRLFGRVFQMGFLCETSGRTFTQRFTLEVCCFWT